MEKEPMLAEVTMNNVRKAPGQQSAWMHYGIAILTIAVAASIRVTAGLSCEPISPGSSSSRESYWSPG